MIYGPPNFYDDGQFQAVRRSYQQQRLWKIPSAPLPPAPNAEAISSLKEAHALYDGPTLHSILQAVSMVCAVPMIELLSSRRERRLADARHVYCYLARTLTPRSYPEIGRRCGGRDHTTILHGFRKVEANLDKYADAIAAAKKLLGVT